MLTKLQMVLSTLPPINIHGQTNTMFFLLINLLEQVYLMLIKLLKSLKIKIRLLNNSFMLLINSITLKMVASTKLELIHLPLLSSFSVNHMQENMFLQLQQKLLNNKTSSILKVLVLVMVSLFLTS